MTEKKPLAGRREIRKAKARKALAAAAVELFSNKGFKESTIEEITKKADLAVGTFYNYFDSKEAMMLSFANDILDDLHDFSKSKMDDSAPAGIVLLLTVNRMCTRFNDQNFLLPFLMEPVLSKKRQVLTQLCVSVVTRFCALFSEIINYGITRTEFRNDIPTPVVSEMLYSIFQSAYYSNLDKSMLNNINSKFKVFLAGISVSSKAA